jgi:hypothetical protein
MSVTAGGTGKFLRMAAIGVVLILAAGVGYDIKNTPPTYLLSATVLLSVPESRTIPDAYESLAPSLISSSAAMVQVMMSPQSQRPIRAMGGTADYDLALVNFYNEDYPNYSDPVIKLTTASPSPAAADRTFEVARRLLHHLLLVRQVQAGVAPRYRISAQVVGNTGPVAQAGSPKRVFGGLALLTAVAASMVWGFLGRRERRMPVIDSARSPANS